jgi:hypothetical protein
LRNVTVTAVARLYTANVPERADGQRGKRMARCDGIEGGAGTPLAWRLDGMRRRGDQTGDAASG